MVGISEGSYALLSPLTHPSPFQGYFSFNETCHNCCKANPGQSVTSAVCIETLTLASCIPYKVMQSELVKGWHRAGSMWGELILFSIDVH